MGQYLARLERGEATRSEMPTHVNLTTHTGKRCREMGGTNEASRMMADIDEKMKRQKGEGCEMEGVDGVRGCRAETGVKNVGRACTSGDAMERRASSLPTAAPSSSAPPAAPSSSAPPATSPSSLPPATSPSSLPPASSGDVDDGKLVMRQFVPPGPDLPFEGGLLPVIGQGGYGVLVETVYKETGAVIAVKLIEKQDDDHVGEAFDREIGFYKTMDTYPMRKMMQWLPRYYASGQMKRGDQTVWIAMERLEQLPLSRHPCMEQNGRSLPAYLFGPEHMLKMLNAVRQLHGYGYVHRDIKPGNFLMRHSKDTYDVVLIDFGLTTTFERSSNQDQWAFCGTVPFASDQQLYGGPVGYIDDLESLGYTFYAMETGRLPWCAKKKIRCDALSPGYSAAQNEPFTSTSISQCDTTSREGLEQQCRDRAIIWESLLEEDAVPPYLMRWIDYCKGINYTQIPDYEYLKSLIVHPESWEL